MLEYVVFVRKLLGIIYIFFRVEVFKIKENVKKIVKIEKCWKNFLMNFFIIYLNIFYKVLYIVDLKFLYIYIVSNGYLGLK